MTIGGVIGEAWRLYTRFFVRFFVIGLVVFAALNLVYALLVEAISSDAEGAAVTLGILGFAIAVIGTTWLQGAFVYAVRDARDGSFDSTLGDVFARVSPAVIPLLVAGLLAGLGIAIGFVLLVIPGLFLLTIWAVIGPVIVVEGTGALDSFGRSRALVRGYGWRDRARHRPPLGDRERDPPSRVLLPAALLRDPRRRDDRPGGCRAADGNRDRGDVLPPARGPRRRRSHARVVTIDPESERRIAEPASADAVREARLTPAEAVEHMRIRLPERGNRDLRRVLERANADRQLKAWWHVSNVNAAVRLEINDHSWVHIQIVANIALKLLRELTKHGVEPSVVRDYGMRNEDAELVVVLSALTHCVGMSVHRRGHEDWSLFLAEPKLHELLEGIYEEPDRTVIVSEVLQAITSHRADGEPLSLEAGILRVADALDMAKGRSRIPFEKGQVSMHSLSAAAVEEVLIGDGETKPVRIEIAMNNSSGLFQVDGLLKAKLRGSGLEPHVEVIAHIDTADEKRLVPEYRLEI